MGQIIWGLKIFEMRTFQVLDVKNPALVMPHYHRIQVYRNSRTKKGLQFIAEKRKKILIH